MNETFEKVGRFRFGYHVKDVDNFFSAAKIAYAAWKDADNPADDPADLNQDKAGENPVFDESNVRDAAFRWVRGGYRPDKVDAALDRLEGAFLQRKRARVMLDEGESAWLEKIYAQATTLYPRMLRPAGMRFRDASGKGYLKTDVDKLLDLIASYFDGKAQLKSEEVRKAVFRPARKNNAYDESVVDVYLDRVIHVLMAVE
ncbi:DivIVA domain-containing protein [Arcanobacterium urinimassiliense]|uniref:DivIVA domain-containing protein n=1 Tax=Arcanobacterium urinimassiliense TaxID=1871014 RepID=UPI00093EB22F|nr:DivIVA domain-containing protein [Arcanobacterium urinimassiliense]MBS6274821.1 DivIVA domain-containing protein [Actinomycetaceae bacterium]